MRRLPMRVLGLMLLSLSLLAGCGAPPTMVGTPPTNLQLDNRNAAGSSGQNFNQQAFLRQLLNEINATWISNQTISCTLTGNYVSLQDGTAGSNKINYDFEKPNKTSMTILQSSEGGMAGTKIVWTGGQQLAVHTQLMGFWLNTTLGIHDSRCTDQRGYYVDQTSISAMMDTLLDPQNQIRGLRLGTLNGVPVAQLDIVSPKSLQGISHEVFTIDGDKKVPIAREMYDQSNRLVDSIQMDNVVLNSTLPSNTFSVN